MEQLAGLLDQLRSLPGLVEKNRAGTFNRGSKSFLHFHAGPSGVSADLKVGDEWERIVVSNDGGAALLRRVRELLG